MNQLHRNLVLAGVLVGTGVLSAYACQSENSPLAAAPRAEPVAAQNQATPSDEAPSSQKIQGKVAEVIQVSKYTYLRIAQPGGSEVWAAVPHTDIEEGKQVAIADPQLMHQFKSSTLNRTFDTIYFGQLAQPGAAGPNPHGAMPPGHPGGPGAASSAASNPHAMGVNPSSGNSVEVGNVAKATGPGAHTVAELFGAKQDLVGKTVRVRGVVVKSVANVMNRSFIHLRDGSGDAKAGTHDVTVTMEAAPPAVGETVMVEGVVATDKDFGAGYTYPVIVENARLVSE